MICWMNSCAFSLTSASKRLPHRPAGRTLGVPRYPLLTRRRSFPRAVTRARWFKSQRKGTSPLFLGESGGGAVPVGYGAISARFRGGAQSGSHRSVSTPCSPNPACGFPAPGSPVGPCASHTEHRTRNLRRTGGLRATSSQKLHGFTRIEPCPARRQACLRPDDIRPSQNARLARLLRLCM